MESLQQQQQQHRASSSYPFRRRQQQQRWNPSRVLSLRITFMSWLLVFGFIASLSVPATTGAAVLPPNERIVGGGSATTGQFPFLASLRTLSGNSHFCGGTINTSRYILTAAHCMANRVALNVKVVTGSILLSSGGATYSLTSITSHPNFNSYTLLNDIAVLKTASSIIFSEQVQPIPITDNFVEHNMNTVAVGWGSQTVLGTISDNLQWINLLTISNTMCQSLMATTDMDKITDASLCTYVSRGQGVCNGDSGGPLVYGSELVGIISWGVPCAQGKPDVYTRISSVYSWIATVVDS